MEEIDDSPSPSSPPPAAPPSEATSRWIDGVARMALAWGFWGPLLVLAFFVGGPKGRTLFLVHWRYPTYLLLLVGALAAFRVASRARLGERRGTAGAVVRFAVYSLVLGILVYALCFPTYKPLPALWVLSSGAALFSCLAWWIVGERKPRLAALDLVLFNLCALLLIVELGLSFAARHSPSVIFEQLGSSVSDRVEATRLRPGQTFRGFPVNGLGHYDEPFLTKKEREEPAVLTIGDSFSIGTVPHFFHHTTEAERFLSRGRIYNMGMSAIGLREYLYLLLNEGLPLEPDAIVITLFMGNDFGGPMPGSKKPSLAVRWLDRRNLLTYLVPHRLNLLRKDAQEKAQERGAEGAAAAEATGASTSQAAEGRGLSEQQLYKSFPWLLDSSLEPPAFSLKRLRKVEQGMATRNSDLTDFDFEERLRRALLPMREAAGEIPILVMMIPARFQVEDDVWNWIVKKEGRELHRDRAQEVTRRWLEANEFKYLDLLPIFRAEVEASGERIYFHNDTHTNRPGNALTGRALARFLTEQVPELVGDFTPRRSRDDVSDTGDQPAADRENG